MQRQRHSSGERSASGNPEHPGAGALAAATLVRGYQLFLRPLVGPACRFAPSCSEYVREALLTHGVPGGTLLALRRVARCHPWGGEGYDPVPERKG